MQAISPLACLLQGGLSGFLGCDIFDGDHHPGGHQPADRSTWISARSLGYAHPAQPGRGLQLAGDALRAAARGCLFLGLAQGLRQRAREEIDVALLEHLVRRFLQQRGECRVGLPVDRLGVFDCHGRSLKVERLAQPLLIGQPGGELSFPASEQVQPATSQQAADRQYPHFYPRQSRCRFAVRDYTSVNRCNSQRQHAKIATPKASGLAILGQAHDQEYHCGDEQAAAISRNASIG
jgi:hypothetical protein